MLPYSQSSSDSMTRAEFGMESGVCITCVTVALVVVQLLPLSLHMNAALLPAVVVTRNGRATAVERVSTPPLSAVSSRLRALAVPLAVEKAAGRIPSRWIATTISRTLAVVVHAALGSLSVPVADPRFTLAAGNPHTPRYPRLRHDPMGGQSILTTLNSSSDLLTRRERQLHPPASCREPGSIPAYRVTSRMQCMPYEM